MIIFKKIPNGRTNFCSLFLKVKENFIPPLLSTVLDDYSRNVPQAREAEVLNTMATIISKLDVSTWLVLCTYFYPYRVLGNCLCLL